MPPVIFLDVYNSAGEKNTKQMWTDTVKLVKGLKSVYCVLIVVGN
jgi:hypothetical protein